MNNRNGKRNVYPEQCARRETTKSIVCSYTKLLEAEKRCLRKVLYKNSVSRFDLNVLTRVYELRKELINETYTTSQGQVFEVYEPKYRKVTSTKFKDRIPQASFVVNYIYPKVISKHTYANCACVKYKGVDYARNLFKEILKESNRYSDYCLKVDFKDYFGSINHGIMFKELSKYMHERWTIKYFQDVINCNHQNIGIGLGSEINQLSAVTLPHCIDEKFINNRYLRYMDDIIFIGSKNECKYALDYIRKETNRLNISISEKKTYIQRIYKPIKFLGFTFLLKSNKVVTLKRIKQKLNNEKRKLRKIKNVCVPIDRVNEHYQSVRSVMVKGNRSGLIKLDKYFNKLFREELQNAIN